MAQANTPCRVCDHLRGSHGSLPNRVCLIKKGVYWLGGMVNGQKVMLTAFCPCLGFDRVAKTQIRPVGLPEIESPDSDSENSALF